MTTFTLDQWAILTLVFLLGLVLGMALLASPKWKQRHREEVARHREEVTRREAVEAENERLRRDGGGRIRSATPPPATKTPRDARGDTSAPPQPATRPAAAMRTSDTSRAAAARDEARRRDATMWIRPAPPQPATRPAAAIGTSRGRFKLRSEAPPARPPAWRWARDRASSSRSPGRSPRKRRCWPGRRHARRKCRA